MFTVTGSEAGRVWIKLNAGHPIYQAHFPGNPITPGVCIIQMVGELAGARIGRRLQLSKIVNLKFVAPVSPTEHPDVEVNFSLIDEQEDGNVKVKGELTADANMMTKFSLVFVLHD